MRLPKRPKLLERKISKTGQTRGADDDVIFQNRVNRNSTVLIPYKLWDQCARPQDGSNGYEKGFIVLISPHEYFDSPNITSELAAKGLKLGVNTLVFYETREQWNAHNPDGLKWQAATRRTDPLGGHYVARVPATTSKDEGKAKKIIRGFHTTKPKGAGIRVYEYASSTVNELCRLQLEALFWLCADSEKSVMCFGMTRELAEARKVAILAECEADALLDIKKLKDARILNNDGKTICPLCLVELSGLGFLQRLKQAEGRDVPDLTVTQVNLFHVNELRYGVLNHRPYNLGWGHHHCNVVVKDSGIIETLKWMREVVRRNESEGQLPD